MGVDPGLLTTGYGVIEALGSKLCLVEGGVVHGGDSSLPVEERLASLYSGIHEVLAVHNPQALALEELYSHYDHPTTAVLMGHARGAICLAAAHSGVPVFSYASTQVKSSLAGNGRATKAQMQRAIQARLGLSHLPEPHDVADALAIAVCHWQMSKVTDILSRTLASTRKR
ncbi:MAG: crossover junction endodeoxyribonuclease RuvC [Chloroflexi bacterium]|nr:crossover junction endodeoxyribonuclease RuvC [Chloroflexota bacterium]